MSTPDDERAKKEKDRLDKLRREAAGDENEGFADFGDEGEEFGADRGPDASGDRNYFEEFQSIQERIQRQMHSLINSWKKPPFDNLADTISHFDTIAEIQVELKSKEDTLKKSGDYAQFKKNIDAIVDLIHQREKIKADLGVEKKLLEPIEITAKAQAGHKRKSGEVDIKLARLARLRNQEALINQPKVDAPSLGGIFSGMRKGKAPAATSVSSSSSSTRPIPPTPRRKDEDMERMRKENDDLRREQDRVNAEIGRLRDEIGKRSVERPHLLRQIEELTRDNTRLTGQLNELEQRRVHDLTEQQRKFDEERKRTSDGTAAGFLARIRELEEQLKGKDEKRDADLRSQEERLRAEFKSTTDRIEQDKQTQIRDLQARATDATRKEREANEELTKLRKQMASGGDASSALKLQLEAQERRVRELEANLRTKELEKNAEITRIKDDLKTQLEERMRNEKADSALERDRLRKQLRDAEARIEDLRRENELNHDRDQRGIGDVRKELNELKQKYEAERRKAEDLQNQVVRLTDSVRQFQRRADEATSETTRLRNEFAQARERAAAADRDRQAVVVEREAMRGELKQERETSRGLTSENRNLQDTLGRERAVTARLQAERAGLVNERDQARADIKAERDARLRAERDLQHAIDENDTIRLLKDEEIDRNKIEIQRLLAEVTKLRAELSAKTVAPPMPAPTAPAPKEPTPPAPPPPPRGGGRRGF